jgi:hypothetical protein
MFAQGVTTCLPKVLPLPILFRAFALRYEKNDIFASGNN